ncbi:hypothetical protein EYZ11_002210 [Aspergillus tanneri]|uniref:Glutaredoxin domain-containing protein n=1 Tax=Aspergillus tanneri TaxID=1220188 RepID=A0A4S3JRF2_9EURO|nr:hypothetical protein EYZ11_002210 [Aspergillus tanneri]
MSAAKTKAQTLINENGVELLKELGAKYRAVELDLLDDGSAIQDALQELTSQRTVPNIFIKQKHIGGNSDLQAKKKDLPALLKDADALQARSIC